MLKRFGHQHGTTWSFQPADAPWYNGSTEALVKTAKRALAVVIGEHAFYSFENDFLGCWRIKCSLNYLIVINFRGTKFSRELIFTGTNFRDLAKFAKISSREIFEIRKFAKISSRKNQCQKS